ncbi:MAG: anaerobic ribonucleoside-triphosphate reductase activating protein [Clostridiales bacterium]|nr:anaerobic ribonucleoside-triphosphate reductase activating protein [Clostridiales bacterium]
MNYAEIKPTDIANGEGVRVSLFVSGCTRKCKNCFNKIAWDFDYGKSFTRETEEMLLKMLAPDYIAGLSLLGGDPFEPSNQRALLPFVKKVKQTFPQKNIWCYTGYTYVDGEIEEKQANCEVTRELISCLDVLIDGRFIEELKDIRLKFRGSSNQRVIDVKRSLLSGSIVLYLT